MSSHAAEGLTLSSDRLGADPGASLATGELSFEDELRPLLGQALGLATAMLLNPSEAEDAVQEAALRAWRRRGNRRPNTDLRPWFLAIVANQCREVRRGRWATVLRFADPPAGVTAAGDREGLLDLRRALLRLPRDARLALVLRYYVDLPIDEVAAVLDCSVDAAKSRVRRGVASLGSSLMSSEDLT